MNELLRTPKDIIAWLDRYGIKNYKLIPDDEHGHVVNVDDDVSLRDKNLSSIDVKFNEVNGFFNCNQNKLKNLKGSPQKVGKDFYCNHKKIASLEGVSPYIGGVFNCKDNLLTNLQFFPAFLGRDCVVDQNQLTSLLGLPVKIKGNFSCSENRLTSLEHCPQIIKNFWCDGNQLVDLWHCPQAVEGKFYCNNNPNLGNVQEIKDFNTIFQIHLELKNIKQEKEKLSNLIKPSATQLKNLYKI